MLKEIFVDGYKSINQESVELKPFTLFSGVNSAGKSSMIQAINCVFDLQRKQSVSQDNRGDAEIGRFVDVRNNIKGNKKCKKKLIRLKKTLRVTSIMQKRNIIKLRK